MDFSIDRHKNLSAFFYWGKINLDNQMHLEQITKRVKKERKMDSRDLSLTSIIAVLYAVLVIVLAPISFGPVRR